MIITDQQRTEIICHADEIERLAGKIYTEKECDLFPRNIATLCRRIRLILNYDGGPTIFRHGRD